MHILFAGGGTAGHINPALAVAGYIKEKDPSVKISYIGTANKLEARLVPAAGYDFYTIEVVGLQRKLTVKNVFKNIEAVYKMFTSSAKARKLLKELKPDIVVGTGGYVSGPVLREAVKLKIPTAIHEQNAFPGITTKALAPNVSAVMLAMPEAEKHLKLNKEPVITGNPVRGELTRITKIEARKKLGINDDRPLVLSFGGSLGARPLNEAILGFITLNAEEKKFHHIHGAGKNGFDSTLLAVRERCKDIPDNIRILEYIDNMDVCMAAADLVVCRAGAITLSEICVCGKPAILIPSPYVAENHQFHNALTLKNISAAEVIEEKELTEEYLKSVMLSLLCDNDKLEKMAENASKAAIFDSNERIYKVIMGLYTKN